MILRLKDIGCLGPNTEDTLTYMILGHRLHDTWT